MNKWDDMKVEDILKKFDRFVAKRCVQSVVERKEDSAFEMRRQRVNDYNLDPDWRKYFD